jgi:hypothetical protein
MSSKSRIVHFNRRTGEELCTATAALGRRRIALAEPVAGLA